MSNFKALDKDSRPIEFAADGDGTVEAPFIPHHKIAGSVAVENFPTTQQVAGSVAVNNFPSVQPVSGSVAVENFPTTQQVAGSVAVENFPTTQQVAGSVAVENFPSVQPISLPDAALITESPLIAVGSTPARPCAGYKYCTYQVDVTGIGTNAVVRVEGNLTGSNYDNLNPSNVDTTLTQNKSYLFSFEGKINNIRLTLVSFSGGAPSITCHLLRGN